jgi:hypothetical protein
MQAALFLTKSRIRNGKADSHADMIAVGRNALIFHDYGCPVCVSGYESGSRRKNVSQAHCAKHAAGTFCATPQLPGA